METILDLAAVKRGALYLKSAGLGQSEAQSRALAIWSELAEGQGLDEFMERIRAEVEKILPKGQARPLQFGHMPTAEFK